MLPFYGPSDGAQSVRDAAGPRTVTKPAGAIDVPVGSFTQATLNAGGTNARFWLLPGTHNVGSSRAPLAGQWIAAASDGSVIIDGSAMSSGGIIQGSPAGVHIQGGFYRNNAVGNGIYLTGNPANGNFIIEDVTTHNNFNIGIAWSGQDSTIRNCYAHHNGIYGIVGTVNNPAIDPRYTGNRVENCHISFNNTRDAPNGADASGTKFVHNDGLYLGSNYVHDNNGVGLWMDAQFRDCLIEENVCENNANSGIFYERSFGGTTIRRNYCKDNGLGTATQPPASLRWNLLLAICDGSMFGGDTIIERNIIDTGDRAFLLWNRTPTGADPPGMQNKQVKVRENDIYLRGTSTGRSGGADFAATKTLWTETSNAFTSNVYHTPNLTGAFWIWGSGTQTSADYTFASWQALALTTGETNVLLS